MDDFHLGRLSVAQDGALALRSSVPAELHFAWRGRACSAAFTGDGVALAAVAGLIPSTAEPGADRPRAFAALSALPAHLPAGWRLRLTPGHAVRFEAAAPLAGPATATALVTAMVRFVLLLDPYLDRLEAAGAMPGSVNTCPG